MFENFHWAAKYRRLYGGLYVKPPGRVVAERTLALACQTIGRVEFRSEIPLPPGIDGDSQEFGFFPGNSRFSHAWLVGRLVSAAVVSTVRLEVTARCSNKAGWRCC